MQRRLSAPVIELLLPSAASLGDTVKIVLRLRNDGPKAITLQLPGRPVAFDVVISRAEGQRVWRRLNHGAVSSALMLLNLPPRGFKDFVLLWPQVDGTGNRVAPGRYRVTGILPIEGGGQLRTRQHELVIK
jgi:hypothetical protein